LKNRSFRAIALDSSFAEQLWQAVRSEQVCRIAALGQQLWRTALGTTLGASPGNSFGEEQLCTAALKNRSFGEHLWGVALERLEFWGTSLGRGFR